MSAASIAAHGTTPDHGPRRPYRGAANTARDAPPRFARGPVLAVAVGVAVVHLLSATVRVRWLDEELVLAIGRRHLAWGSVDTPPLTPALAALADAVAPGSQVVRGLPGILAAAVSVVIAALIARELGGDARAQTLTAIAQATGVWVAGHWLVPYHLEPVQWATLTWLLVRWHRTRDDRLLLVLGVVAGIAALTKFQVILLCAVLLLAVALLGPRTLLGRPLLWAGAAVAALLAAPTLIWQAAHGWPQLRMAEAVATDALIHGGRPGVAIGLVASAGVLGAALGVYGLARLLAAPQCRELRYLGATTVVLFVAFVIPPGRPYYLAGLYALLSAVGAVGLMRRRVSGRTRWSWVAWPVSACSVLVALVGLASAQWTASPTVPDAVSTTTARVHAGLPDDQRERTALFARNYLFASYLDAAPPEVGLPPAHSGNRSYGYFEPPPESQDAALIVGDPSLMRPWFTETRLVGEVDLSAWPDALAGSTSSQLWLLEGRTAPWTTIVPALRELVVR